MKFKVYKTHNLFSNRNVLVVGNKVYYIKTEGLYLSMHSFIDFNPYYIVEEVLFYNTPVGQEILKALYPEILNDDLYGYNDTYDKYERVIR